MQLRGLRNLRTNYLLPLVSSSSCYWSYCMGSGDSSVVRAYTCDGKVPSSSPGRSKGRIFFSRVSFLC